MDAENEVSKEQTVGFHNRIGAQLAEEIEEVARQYGIRKGALLEQALTIWLKAFKRGGSAAVQSLLKDEEGE